MRGEPLQLQHPTNITLGGANRQGTKQPNLGECCSGGAPLQLVLPPLLGCRSQRALRNCWPLSPRRVSNDALLVCLEKDGDMGPLGMASLAGESAINGRAIKDGGTNWRQRMPWGDPPAQKQAIAPVTRSGTAWTGS